MNLGAGYLRQGQHRARDRGSASARSSSNPRLVDAHSTIAIAYDQIAVKREAETHYQRATSLDPATARGEQLCRVSLNRQNRWQTPSAYFRRAADNPSYHTRSGAHECRHVRARCRRQRARPKSTFARRSTRNPSIRTRCSSMIELAYRGRNYTAGSRVHAALSRCAAGEATVLWLCFNIERELDNPPGAERCAAQLREGFPGSPEVAQLQERTRRDDR